MSLQRFQQLENRGDRVPRETDPSQDLIRKKLCQLTQLFLREHGQSFMVYHLSVVYFDTYVSNVSPESEALLEIMMGCILLASKLISVNDVEVSQFQDFDRTGEAGKYEIISLIETEYKIYKRFDGRLIMPTPFYFSLIFANELKLSLDYNQEKIIHSILYIVSKNKLSTYYLPSIIGFAALHMTIKKTEYKKDDKPLKIFKRFDFTQTEVYKTILFISKTLDREIDEKHVFLPKDITNLYLPVDSTEGIPEQLFIKLNIPIQQKKFTEEGDPIGEGAFGSVVKAVDSFGKEVAIKQFVCEISKISVDAAIEISILKEMKNAGVIHAVGFNHREESDCIEVFLPLMEMNLKDKIKQKGISKDLKKRYIYQLFDGLNYLHSFDILHGDVKLENILIQGDDIKLADFGISKPFIKSNRLLYQIVYTLIYRPPEVLLKYFYDLSADIWAAGIVSLEIFSNKRFVPFKLIDNWRNKTKEMYGYITSFTEIVKDKKVMNLSNKRSLKKNFNLDDKVLDFITFILNIDHSKRPSISQILREPLLV